MVPTNPNLREVRLPDSPPPADSLSPSMSDWPAEINKIHDS